MVAAALRVDVAACVAPILDAEMGRRLRIAREILGKHQRDLAKEFDVSQRTISGMERGQAGLRVAVSLKRFQIVFGTELADFIVTGKHAAVYVPRHHAVMRKLAEQKEKNRT